MVESAPIAIVVVDRDGRITLANTQAERWFGYTREELLGKQIELLVPDRLREAHIAGRRSFLTAPEPRVMDVGSELYLLRKDGREFPVEIRRALVETESGARILTFIEDITERKQAEAALKESEQRLRLIIENAQHGLWDWEIAKDHQYLDDRCRAILGYEPGESATYEHWLQGVHPEDKPRVLAALDQNFKGETALLDVDYRFARKNGEWIWISARGRVHQRSADGKPLRMMGTINDISARKTAELERGRFETQIQHAQKLESLGVLAGGIAHDFNNLLTGVLGNATLAQEELPPGSPVIPMLRNIELAATRAADLAQQMLAYSGKGQFTIQVFQLDRVVREMNALLKTVVSKKAIMQQHLESAVIDGDPRQIRQVVMNLITNASEALGDQVGTIHVSTGIREMDEAGLRSPFLPDPLPPGPYAFVEVADTGCGMSDETLGRIFDPFFTTKFTGRGLGLAAVLGIVRGHRGTIKVSSKAGGAGSGSVFSVLIPVASETVAVKAEAPPKALALGRGTILVVEDEDVVRDYAQAALERAGYRVLTASDGSDGLTIFGGHRTEIDAVLLDLTMPRLDGPEVLRELRNQAPDIPVLIMSGFTDEEVATRFEGIGASGFIRKPFAVQDLTAQLRRLLVSND
jgi:PAS domain S-box-containing protein